jgi:hypothetical protein
MLPSGYLDGRREEIGRMPTLSLQSVIQREPGIVAAEAGEDVVMVSIENGQYYGVSQVARAIWEAIERPITVSDLINYLIMYYNVDSLTCEKDTLAFLEQLAAERLLQVVHGPAS